MFCLIKYNLLWNIFLSKEAVELSKYVSIKYFLFQKYILICLILFQLFYMFNRITLFIHEELLFLQESEILRLKIIRVKPDNRHQHPLRDNIANKK